MIENLTVQIFQTCRDVSRLPLGVKGSACESARRPARPGRTSGTSTSLVGRVRTRRTRTCGLTYKRRADAPADSSHVTPPHPFPYPPTPILHQHVLRGNTTFCDAVQLSPEPPPSVPPHHRRRPTGTDVRTRCRGASLCLLLPPPPLRPFIHSFIHQKEHTP